MLGAERVDQASFKSSESTEMHDQMNLIEPVMEKNKQTWIQWLHYFNFNNYYCDVW